jgi:hypothetical protein
MWFATTKPSAPYQTNPILNSLFGPLMKLVIPFPAKSNGPRRCGSPTKESPDGRSGLLVTASLTRSNHGASFRQDITIIIKTKYDFYDDDSGSTGYGPDCKKKRD